MANALSSGQQPNVDMPSAGNPLAAPPTPKQAPQMPVIDPSMIDQHLDDAAYALPIVAKLAAKKDVSRKDVIKAISDAVAAKRIEIDPAMEMLATIPDQPSQLKPWLQTKVEHITRGAVHLAAMKKMGNAIHQAHQMTVQQMQAAGLPHNPTPPPGAIPPNVGADDGS